MSDLLHTFDNADDGLQSRIVTHALGFSVTLWDTDADAAVPMAKIFPDEERAIDYAQSIVA